MKITNGTAIIKYKNIKLIHYNNFVLGRWGGGGVCLCSEFGLVNASSNHTVGTFSPVYSCKYSLFALFTCLAVGVVVFTTILLGKQKTLFLTHSAHMHDHKCSVYTIVYYYQNEMNYKTPDKPNRCSMYMCLRAHELMCVCVSEKGRDL